MKLQYIKTISLSVALLLTICLSGCTADFVDKNTNPDNATDEMLSHDNLKTGSAFRQMVRNMIPAYQAQSGSVDEYGSSNYQIIQDLAGNIFAGYTGATKDSFTANNLYNLKAATWRDAAFDHGYTRCIAAWKILNELREEFPEQAAMGDIIKVALLCRLTDMYGPIPYSSITGTGIQNNYDKQEDVYNGLLAELANAIKTLTDFCQAQPSAKLLAKFDDVYSGNVTAWVKFANTLRLRMAMRLYFVDRSKSETEAVAAVSNAIGVMTAAGDVAQLSKPSTGAWEYPLYMIQYNFNDGDSRMGATIDAYMNGYNDPRLAKYFTKGSDGGYHGVRIGISSSVQYAKSDLISKVNCTNSDALLWMTPAEAYFLRAEGAMRGWAMGDTAENLYNNGIRMSFSTLGVSGAEEYLSNNTLTPVKYEDKVSNNGTNTAPSTITIAWNNSASDDVKLERIITQKYIAMFPEGQEAWTEFRRTGYPKIIPVVRNSSSGEIDDTQQIRRLIYPSTELATNAEAVEAAIEMLRAENTSTVSVSGDVGGQRLWWDRKN
ncbi:SusD/RagB family nutrient-binding outer membrane lipoprotein [uncultured Alistipes sp.]|jgi:susD homolog|uniref:SusD/RagB family nutrient-binding outer membrane lipoprotein n=1 Tax=uncultured Alistipes sp. TaxID=538949 RepID=UPI0025D6A8A8|nr:SusD/RagB family nutrient-binding outer membrane lipoprotein [uncultured Alistipes sp.]